MGSTRTWALVVVWSCIAVVLVREVAVVAASHELLGAAGTLGVQLASALLVLLAARGPDRRPWIFVAAGMLAWTGGDVYYFAVLGDDPAPPVPSPADVGYLLFPVLVFVGLSMLLRRRVVNASRFLWVDGVVAALAVAALSAAVVVEAVLGMVGGTPMAVVTTLAYPLSDLVLLGFVAAAAALSGWRLDRTWLLIGAALVSFWLADSLYLLRNAAGTYGYPDPVDAGWDLAYALLAAAAWQRRRPPAPADARPTGARHVALPLLFGASGLVLLSYAGLHQVTPLAVALAALSLVGVMARLALTFRENRAILDATRREALTDALTGLGNRRALAVDLEDALGAGPDAPSVALALFDLDGFKHYNDTFGHPAGDALLTRLGAALEREIGADGRAYRMGGDEFCALLELRGRPAGELVERAAAALAERGDGFAITSSHGAIVLPAETAEADEALRIADQRLYAHKQGNRASAGRQSREVLLRALLLRHPELAEHSRDVARWAGALARELGLDASDAERVTSAAELADIGKVGVPDAILDKEEPLEEEELSFVRRHPVMGERIIGGAPALAQVAAMVRASHERWDGLGYPDGLAGEDIPLGARVIAAADAFAAMTTERRHAAARGPEDALAELRRCAATQFDPQVVEAFSRVLARDRVPA